MNTSLLTGIIAAVGVLAAFAGVGEARAQEGSHEGHGAQHGHRHADFASDRLHVRVDGDMDGRDIILIPGLASSPEAWQGTVDHLTAQEGVGWRIHRIHVQGFAGAPAEGAAQQAGTPTPVAAPVAEEIARYIREQNLNKPVVVGHSMGGTIGLMLAARHPDLVGRLMVVDMVPYLGLMFAGPTADPAAVAAVADQVYAGQANATRADYDTRSAAAITGMIDDAAARAGPLEDGRTSDQQVAAAAFRELIVTDLRPELSRITAPTEVLYVAFRTPGATPAATDAIYQGAYAALPGVTLKRIDDGAHFIMLDQPATFHADLDAFLSAE